MIVITGAAGFIGSTILQKLNEEGREDLILVDEFSRADKNRNFLNKGFLEAIDRDVFTAWFWEHAPEIEGVIHMGARTDTTEKDTAVFDRLNLNYSKELWQICTQYQIPFVYASSAATYGLGELGYDDRHDIIEELKPLNPYGVSKNDFDIWVMKQEEQPPFWAGLKFFNVYGPNEYHKGRMASVILHTVRQIRETGGMKLFRSHRSDIQHGHQSRDFVYIRDVVDMVLFLYRQQPENGLFNIGTGQARTFLDLATNTFKSLGLEPNISFVDTPADIRDTYQYFTEANMRKIRQVGYNQPFHSLEQGVEDYVKNYLMEDKLW